MWKISVKDLDEEALWWYTWNVGRGGVEGWRSTDMFLDLIFFFIDALNSIFCQFSIMYLYTNAFHSMIVIRGYKL